LNKLKSNNAKKSSTIWRRRIWSAGSTRSSFCTDCFRCVCSSRLWQHK